MRFQRSALWFIARFHRNSGRPCSIVAMRKGPTVSGLWSVTSVFV